jgi:hypothetical protein
MSTRELGAAKPKYLMRLHEIPNTEIDIARLEFRQFADVAFEDVRNHLRQALVPLGGTRGLSVQLPVGVDPAAGFPSRLHDTVKKGILGELWAGFLAEQVTHDGHDDWRVPKFLFRFHKGALDQLQRSRATNGPLTPIPGRLGDDCIAVRLEDDDVGCLLVAESKCTGTHNATLIKDAHVSFRASERVPADLINLISILQEYTDPDSLAYLGALQRCYISADNQPPMRIDYLVYVCGQNPIRRPSWIPSDAPRAEYKGGRRLEASEVHLDDVGAWLEEVLGP